MPDETDEDLEEHPWLTNYRSKNQIEKIEILTEAVKNLEKNTGVNSIITIINSIFIAALLIGVLANGVIEIGSEAKDAAFGAIRDTMGLGE